MIRLTRSGCTEVAVPGNNCPMEFEVAPTTLEFGETGIAIRWSNGHRSRFHTLWLRDNCTSGGDKRGAHRTALISDLDPNLVVYDAHLNDDGDVEVSFSDGHVSTFDPGWLLANCPEPETRLGRSRRIAHFRAGTPLREFSLPSAGGDEHGDLLDAVKEWGVALVHDVPGDEAGTEQLAALIGKVRDSDFGRLFDIVVEPDAWESSQSTEAQDPHTDDPYRYSPSGTSILHCVEVSTTGGDSLLVDGFAVAEQFRDDDPDGFELLSTVSVPFVRHRAESVDQGEDVHLVADATVIAVDRDDEICGIRFHQRAFGPFDINPAIMGDYYRALIEFGRRINDPVNTIQLRLEPGQALVYDNQRALHGRTAFSIAGGRRHVRLCTIDRDQFHSRLRRLREELERPGADERLAVGNLS